MGPLRTAVARLDARLRRLDERLHIDHTGRSEWVWLGPLGTFVGTLALICVAGAQSGVGAAVYAPIGVFVAVMMTGMSIAYMTPAPDVEPGDGGGGDDAPEAGGPAAPPWYRRLFEATGEEPAPRPRERSGTR